MNNNDFESISFVNQNYNFSLFYGSMKNVLLELCEETRIYDCSKIILAFISGYLFGVSNDDLRESINDEMINFYDELHSDDELVVLKKREVNNVDISIKYMEKYYYYYMKGMRLLSRFIGSLSDTLMPTTVSTSKKVAYSNYQEFFRNYALVKDKVSENLSSFNVRDYQKPINNMIVFYYGYEMFVTRDVSSNVKKAIGLIVEFISQKKFMQIIKKEFLTTSDTLYVNKARVLLYKSSLRIYSKLNKEHSKYNLNQKIEHKVYVDKTGI